MGDALIASDLRLGVEARIRLPNVDETLDHGHALYGADDPKIAGSYSQRLAQQLAQEFMDLKATPNTPEVPYLRAMKHIARGYARALTRLRAECDKEKEKAEQERARLLSQLRGGRLGGQVTALWKYLAPLLLGLLGYIGARIVGGILPLSVTTSTHPAWPTTAAVIGAMLLGRLVSKWLYDRKSDKIARLCDVWEQLADQAYDEGKEAQMKYWRARACEAWLEYTGEVYPDRLSYQIVLEGDNVRRKELREHRGFHRQSDFERLRQIFADAKSNLKLPKRGERAATKIKKEQE